MGALPVKADFNKHYTLAWRARAGLNNTCELLPCLDGLYLSWAFAECCLLPSVVETFTLFHRFLKCAALTLNILSKFCRQVIRAVIGQAAETRGIL